MVNIADFLLVSGLCGFMVGLGFITMLAIAEESGGWGPFFKGLASVLLYVCFFVGFLWGIGGLCAYALAYMFPGFEAPPSSGVQVTVVALIALAVGAAGLKWKRW